MQKRFYDLKHTVLLFIGRSLIAAGFGRTLSQNEKKGGKNPLLRPQLQDQKVPFTFSTVLCESSWSTAAVKLRKSRDTNMKEGRRARLLLNKPPSLCIHSRTNERPGPIGFAWQEMMLSPKPPKPHHSWNGPKDHGSPNEPWQYQENPNSSVFKIHTNIHTHTHGLDISKTLFNISPTTNIIWLSTFPDLIPSFNPHHFLLFLHWL